MKFILLALVAALVLMGAAYAAWTQTFTINSSVETGELFIKIENTNNEVLVDKNGDGYYGDDEKVNPSVVGLNVSPTFINGANEKTTLSTISYKIDNMYPGIKIISTFTFENIGSINATTSAEGTTGTNKDDPLWRELVIRVGDGSPISGSNAGNKIHNLAEAIKNAVGDLTVGEKITVTIIQELPYSSQNETENQKLDWSVTLAFKQAFTPSQP